MAPLIHNYIRYSTCAMSVIKSNVVFVVIFMPTNQICLHRSVQYLSSWKIDGPQSALTSVSVIYTAYKYKLLNTYQYSNDDCSVVLHFVVVIEWFNVLENCYRRLELRPQLKAVAQVCMCILVLPRHLTLYNFYCATFSVVTISTNRQDNHSQECIYINSAPSD